VEAFFAILLIVAIMLIVLSERNPTEEYDTEIHDSQIIILRDIQMNSTLRQSILDVVPPVESEDAGFPQDVKDRIEYFSLNYISWKAKICEIDSSCNLNDPLEKEVYAESVIITATTSEYNPKQLKLFCWRE